MKINTEEIRSAEFLTCLIILTLVIGLNTYIYLSKGTSAADYSGRAYAAEVKWEPDQAAISAHLNRALAEKSAGHHLASLAGEKADYTWRPREVAHFTWVQELVRVVAQSNSAIHSVGFLGTDGTVLAHTENNRIGANLAHSKFFRDAMRGETGSDTAYHEKPPAALRIVSVPVKANGKTVGVLYATVEASQQDTGIRVTGNVPRQTSH